MLTSHQMQVLVRIHTQGSILKAAIDSNTSQSSVSRMVKQIEEKLGVDLFHRTGRGVETTGAGAVVLDFCEKSIAAAEELQSALSIHHGPLSGIVTVGMPPSISRILTLPLMERVSTTAPGIDLDLFTGFTGDIFNMLSEGHLDVAVMYENQHAAKTLTDKVILDDLFLIEAARPGIACKPEITLAEAATVPVVLPSRKGGVSSFAANRFTQAGLTPNIAMNIDANIVISDLVCQGALATLGSYSLFWREIDSGLLQARRVVMPTLTREIWVATGSSAPMTKAKRFVASELRRLMLENMAAARWRLY